MLTAKQNRFVIEYPVDSNGTLAAIRAGYSEDSAGSIASELLAQPHIQAAIAERVADIAAAAAITPELVLRMWLDIARADPNEIIRNETQCCRWCYGIGHQYQWTVNEYERAVKAAVESKKPEPTPMGGFGFDPHRPPVMTCPECHGEGVDVVRMADTNKLSGPARRLYAGIRKTKDGVQVLMRDQDKALENIAKFLGMSIDRKEVSGPGGGPIPLSNAKAEDLSDDQLAAIANAAVPE